MGYKTVVITYDDRIDDARAFNLVANARVMFKVFNKDLYVTDEHKVIETPEGYRITKRYNIEPICKWRAPNTCKVCAQDRCDE